MEIGETVTVGKVTGKLLEIVELETEKKLKIETASSIAIVTYVKREQAGLGEMRLG